MDRALGIILASLLLAGCASAPEPAGPAREPGYASAELNVVVWSTLYQGPVPAEGTLTCVGTGNTQLLDTRRSPEAGQTFRGLQPGLYRVRVSRRFDGLGEDRQPHLIDGAGEIYLEPGARSEMTVVASERDDDIGGAERDATPVAASADR